MNKAFLLCAGVCELILYDTHGRMKH